MLMYALGRALSALAVAFTVSIIVFLLLHLSGDLAASIAGPEATKEHVDAIRFQFGLDRPLIVQYGSWLWSALHLDFGKSYYFSESVFSLISSRLHVTFTMGLFALLMALLVAIPVGMLAAIYSDGWIDNTARGFSVIVEAMPSFWLGLIFIMLFAVKLGWFPVSGSQTWHHLVLPSVVIALNAMPAVMRMTRSGMLDVLSADYIRTAHAKGLPSRKIMIRHALRNAIIPVVALAAVQFGHMLSGSVVLEAVFSVQGVGQLAWMSISRNDFPVVQAIVLVLAVIYVTLTFVADLLNGLLDPRIRS